MYPSVKNLPISKERANSIKNEIISTMNHLATSRRLLRRIYVNDSPEFADNEGFVTVGVNTIIDRIWFVDNPSNEEYYSYQGIGVDIAEGIAETEGKYITDCIFKSKPKTIVCDSPLNPAHLRQAIYCLSQNSAQPNILLLNIKDHIQLWHYPYLAKNGRFCIPSEFSGLKNDIEIDFFRLLPEGMSLMVDSEKLGTLVIKKRIEDTTVIQDIEEKDFAKILAEIPKLDKAKLPEKVRVRSFEIIKAIIEDPSGAVIINVKEPTKNKSSPP